MDDRPIEREIDGKGPMPRSSPGNRLALVYSGSEWCAAISPRAILSSLVALGNTLAEWTEEIGSMWRFTRNNGITEGFRNFNNCRMRVKVLCA